MKFVRWKNFVLDCLEFTFSVFMVLLQFFALMCKLIDTDEFENSFQYVVTFPFFALTVAVIRHYFDKDAILTFPTKEGEVSDFLQAFIESCESSCNLR